MQPPSLGLASTVMAIGVAASQTYHYNKFYLPIYALIGVVNYLVILRAINAFKPVDMQLMKEYLGPRFGLLIRPFERFLTSWQR